MEGDALAPIDAPRESAGRLFLRGSVWAVIGYAGAQVLRFASNLILWRLLAPEVFGVMALVNSVLTGLQMFSDLGIGQSIIQNARGEDPRFLDTAWTLQVLRGGLLALIGLACAVPAARFYDAPALAPLLAVSAIAALVQGFASTQIFTTTRDVALRPRTLLDLGSQLVGFVITLVWALLHPTVWAIVWGGFAAAVVRTVASHFALGPRRDRLAWHRDSLGGLLHFARWIFISTVLIFVASQSDRLIFGKLVSLGTLGVYSIAQIWATVPGVLVGHLILSVVFPVLSRVRNRGADLHAGFIAVRTPLLFALGWLVACLLSGGQSLIDFLYDARAVEAGWMIRLLVLGSFFGVLENAYTTALLAHGHPNWTALANLAKVVGMFVLIPLGFALADFPGAVAGFAGSEVFKYVVAAVGAHRHRLAGLRQDMSFGVATGVTALIGIALSRELRTLGAIPLLEGAAVGTLQCTFWGAAFLLWNQRRKSRPHGPPMTSESV